ncbi:putative coiled-coil domain-containing protein [Rosellinia necatrix]|uniref:Putative coiled-coil domain-containing protein n=1 Tax=Rosellinia necatrix TaxID=77044 RepID=A0A1W2TNM0_ROSNE|nr:putative coiled-coil domain-containing protein [Rosellinia necatrix]
MAPLIGPPHPVPHNDHNNHTATPPPDPPSSSSSSSPYERPQPRPPRTPAHAARVRVRNRRREWLSRHPSYVRSLEHELADPLLYDALVRRFQSPEEREREGRAKGFGRALEADLLRGEARLSRLEDGAADGSRASDGSREGGGGGGGGRPASGAGSTDGGPTPEPSCSRSARAGGPELSPALDAGMSWEELETRDLEKRPAPRTAEEGRARWDEFLRLRFVAGGDDDFHYPAVDEDDEYDALERREQEDAWFDDEEPSWIGESDGDESGDEMGSKGGEKKTEIERPLIGETGVQDF